jgi:Fic family protein
VKRETGRYITTSTFGELVKAFVPNPLPPQPPVELDNALNEMLINAALSLGRLDSISTLLPDRDIFLYYYVRKEAVLSSQIEGTQSSLSDLLLFENDFTPGVPIADVTEVSRYVAALEHGMTRLREGFPLSLRLLKEIHGILLESGRGSNMVPGEFRRSQNWIGGTRPGMARHVPPPPDVLMDCMGALEKFLHNEPIRTPILLKAALVHVQFETIHPFLDGNGRIGRLLITLLFCLEGVLHEPLLYVSLYFKRHRQEYYDHLQAVRTEGDWESWIAFFLEAVQVTAEQSVASAKRLANCIRDDRIQIERVPRIAGSLLQTHAYMTRRIVGDITKISQTTGLSFNTIKTSLKQLEALGIVREVTGRQRDRVWIWEKGLRILEGEI